MNKPKTLTFETSKRLNKEGYIRLTTEYYYDAEGNITNEDKASLKSDEYYKGCIGTLTLEEAIDFLPKNTKLVGKNRSVVFGLKIQSLSMGEYKWKVFYGIVNKVNGEIGEYYGKTLLEAIEKMLLHLLENNLLK